MVDYIPTFERHGRFLVVRDDKIPGGTKQIILRDFLPTLGKTHFVYVASVFGKGGAALAHACAELGFQATLFMAETKTRPSWVDDVEKLGTEIIWTDLVPVADIEPVAHDQALENGAHYVPLGFDHPTFHTMLRDYARKLPMTPTEIWCPIVSGTLASGLEAAFPDAKINGVSVVKNPGYIGHAKIHYAVEKFVRVAATPPPYPSWPYSDAKVWALAQKHGADDALIWNSNS